MNRYLKTIKLRPDLAMIADIVPDGARVLDLGCGNGDLLYVLKYNKNAIVQGIEISQEGIMECICKGIPVYQGNLDEGLVDIADGSFDYVIMSQTLQVVHNAELMVSEILRVGTKGIVSFPNFAYWKLRTSLMLTGRMPKSEMLPYEWYNTPNIRLLTIRDFRSFCQERNLKIEKEIFIEPNGKEMSAIYNIMPNIFAHLGIAVISR